ncbi:MAG: ferredoxin [Geminicoccaceae bacterium]
MPLNPLSSLAELQQRLGDHGLTCIGGFAPAATDDAGTAAQILVVANIGSAMFERFRKAPEAGDGKPDPLDRWTRRIVDVIAADAAARPVYPFDGPPWPPFQRWALRADPGLHRSPIGLLVSAASGPWLGLRAALLLAEPLPLPERPAIASPCDDCATKPCLTTCPVGAFRQDGYRVADCRAYLGTLSGQSCMMLGCAARRACPAGREHAYGQAHATFHMRAFRSSPGASAPGSVTPPPGPASA